MSELSIHPLGPRIGAEVHGVDLREMLSPLVQKQIHETWLDHQVIFFRDQVLTLDQHKNFGRQFGELHIHPNVTSHPDHEEVLVIHSDEKSRHVAGQGWHSDVSCDLIRRRGAFSG